MFVPFAIALGTAIMAVCGKKNISYICWIILFIATLFTFNYHVVLSFNLSF
ncbi:DUF5993 family protein [Bartonella gliris]|uniref:DUF5993 family protein n=1 Tax=Bartonella gliris TaxID=3004109 RepID=UPI003872C682